MPHDLSIPLDLGLANTLRIQQKQKPSSGLGFFKSLTNAIRSGDVRVQHVFANEPAVLEVHTDGDGPEPEVTSGSLDGKQTVTVTTLQADPAQIVLKWPRGEGLAALHLSTETYGVRFDINIDDIAAAAPRGTAGQRLALSEVDFLPARDTSIATTSGSVTGLVPMQDALDISTTSGKASITLLPLRGGGGDEGEKAAQPSLAIKTNAGSISLNTGIDPAAPNGRIHLPGEDFHVALQSSSGSIHAVTGLPRLGTVRSNSGSQTVKVHPTGDGQRYGASLTTTSSSGSQSLSFHAGEGFFGKDCVFSHQANSGSVKVGYPATWTGKVHASSGAGSIGIKGDGVQVEKKHGHVEAVKGDCGLDTNVKTSAGSISVTFG